MTRPDTRLPLLRSLCTLVPSLPHAKPTQAQNRRVKALEAELAACRASAADMEARLRAAERTISALRSDASDAKTALAAHVAELLATQDALRAARGVSGVVEEA